MISMLFPNKNLILIIIIVFPYFAIYLEPLCVTYATFGGGGSQMVNFYTLFGGNPQGPIPGSCQMTMC